MTERSTLRALANFLSSYLLVAPCFAQHVRGHGLAFIENKGQWDPHVLFRTAIGTGNIFLERDGFTYDFLSGQDMMKAHDRPSGKSESTHLLRGHAWNMRFIGVHMGASIELTGKQAYYSNFFLGNDAAKWQGHVGGYGEVTYKGLYAGVDAHMYSEGGNFKYDLIVKPGGAAASIAMAYSGMHELQLVAGRLIVRTSVGEFVESEPYSYQVIGGRKVDVLCNYVLQDDRVRFDFPNGYDHGVDLVIDPTLIAATLSGGIGMTNGHTSAYDNDGNIFAIGHCYSPGFPVTLGAYDTTLDGVADVVVSKFNPDGTTLLWATYLGGSSSEFPYSATCNAQGELFVLGNTGSADHPVTAGAYDVTLNGLTDLVVSHLTADGASLLGATYIGGSGYEDFSAVKDPETGGSWIVGELIVDMNGDPCFVAITYSPDFPVTPGCAQSTFGGVHDAVVCRLDAGLTTLMASTYFGGSEMEEGRCIREAADGTIFIAGSTRSADMPVTAGAFQTTPLNLDDGYIVAFNSTLTTLTASTYFGSISYNDVVHALDLDAQGDVWITGHAFPFIPVTPGTYSNAGSGTFICELTPALDQVLISSVVGDGASFPVITPTAFDVDDCGIIRLSAEGPHARPDSSFQVAFGDTIWTNGLVTTPDALYGELPYTDHDFPGQYYHAFYVAVYGPDMSSLEYATYYPGTHQHGGLSKIDGNGNLYQVVCVAPRNQVDHDDPYYDFVAMPGAWDPDNPDSTGYDIGVFKLLLDVPAPYSDVAITSTYACEPNTVSFATAPGTGTATLVWNFGDGSAPGTGSAPDHTYASSGNYTVMLSIAGPCDTTMVSAVIVAVDPSPMVVHTTVQLPCLSSDGASTHAVVTGGLAPYTFGWSPSGGSAADAENLLPGNYTVTVTDHSGCQTVTDDVVIDAKGSEVFVPNAFSPDASGRNDEQCVYGPCISTMVFSIYDRWGTKVFETTDMRSCWDGTFNGTPLNPAVFVYHLSATLSNGEAIVKQGNITLIR